MKTFWQKNKLLIAILAFGVVTTSYLYKPSYTKQQETQPSIIEKTEAQPSTILAPNAQNTDESIELPIQKAPGRLVVAVPATATVPKAEDAKSIEKDNGVMIPITFEIPHIVFTGKSFDIEAGSTGHDAMLALQLIYGVEFTGHDFGTLGFFIESIGGIKNDTLKGKYWIYYINGSKAQIGISNYIVQPNDIITWKYEHEKI